VSPPSGAPAPRGIPRALAWQGGVEGRLEILDQRALPHEERTLACTGVPEVFEAIRTLAVRGAPAIGVAGAYGAFLGLGGKAPASAEAAQAALEAAADALVRARPTAVNLAWALERMRARAARCVAERLSGPEAREALLAEARAIEAEDAAHCRAIGAHGAPLVREGARVLTHCNAGALATAGIGTALGVLYTAHERGRRFQVFADETRPLLQGARLTAWELARAGIDVTLIPDVTAGALMARGSVDLVIVGADRIARNGDTANKIGTYGVARLAAAHGVPFYVAAPSSTFDLAIASGAEIPIEERAPEEVRGFSGAASAPAGVKVWNPAFDVTPAELIRGIITERGVIEPPSERAITAALAGR
jgi:methylthioribose-1-phosphate isomerase